ncbi:MAG: DUF2997 domain-containing protein [archaeon]
MGKEIIITFDENGESTVETKGFKGRECKKASEFIEKGLGNKLDDKHTREYYQKEDVSNRVRRRR